jgi:gas vesicle protein
MNNFVVNLLSGLLGAVIGAIAGAVTALYVQWRERRHERRAAARMGLMEIVQNMSALKTYLAAKTWDPLSVKRTYWESEGARMAEAMSLKEIVTVGQPYLTLQQIAATEAIFYRNDPHGNFGAREDTQATIRSAVDECEHAVVALMSLAEFTTGDLQTLVTGPGD